MPIRPSDALAVVGVLAANPGLEIWIRAVRGGRNVGRGRYVGKDREFLTPGRGARNDVGENTMRLLIAHGLITYVGFGGPDERRYRLADMAERKRNAARPYYVRSRRKYVRRTLGAKVESETVPT